MIRTVLIYKAHNTAIVSLCAKLQLHVLHTSLFCALHFPRHFQNWNEGGIWRLKKLYVHNYVNLLAMCMIGIE